MAGKALIYLILYLYANTCSPGMLNSVAHFDDKPEECGTLWKTETSQISRMTLFLQENVNLFDLITMQLNKCLEGTIKFDNKLC